MTVAVLVLIAQLIGRALRLNAVSTAQAMTTALLVMTIGGATSATYAVGRIVETIVGAVIGVAINAFLVPPTYLPAAVASYEALADALRLRQAVQTLEHTATRSTGCRARSRTRSAWSGPPG